MLHLRKKPVGIDFYIQRLQTALYSQLTGTWGVDENTYQAYGRAYRNKTDGGYVAQVFAGGGDYVNAYWDDKFWALSFFGISNNIKYAVGYTADVHLVFFVNIEKLKPGLEHRGDEEVRLDVTRIIGNGLLSFTPVSIDLSLDNVLREYSGTAKTRLLKAVDMHPVHAFRMNFKVLYDSNKIC